MFIHSFGLAHLKNDSVSQDGDFLLQQRLPGHKDLAVVHPPRPAAAKTDVSSSLRARSREEKETLGVKVVPLLPGRRLLGSSPSLMVLAVRRQSLSQGSVQDVFELILHLLQDPALQLLQGTHPESTVQSHNQHHLLLLLLHLYYSLLWLAQFCCAKESKRINSSSTITVRVCYLDLFPPQFQVFLPHITVVSHCKDTHTHTGRTSSEYNHYFWKLTNE